MDLTSVASVATIVGVPVAMLAAFYTWKSARPKQPVDTPRDGRGGDGGGGHIDGEKGTIVGGKGGAGGEPGYPRGGAGGSGHIRGSGGLIIGGEGGEAGRPGKGGRGGRSGWDQFNDRGSQ